MSVNWTRVRTRLNTMIDSKFSPPPTTNINYTSNKREFINSLITNLSSATGTRRYTKLLSNFTINPESFLNSQANIFKARYNNSFYTNSRTATRRPKTRSREEKYPWYLVKLSNNGQGGVNMTLEPILIPGFALPLENNGAKKVRDLIWRVNWNMTNMNVFPKSTTGTIKNSNNSVKVQSVGRFCQGPSPLPSFCGRRTNNLRWSETFPDPVTTPNKTIINKNGVRGLSVHSLTSLLSRSSPALKRRRYYLDIKRAGDWGEIFGVKTINNDPQVAIVNPGSLQFSQEFGLTQWTDVKQELYNNLRSKGVLFFMNACFWSGDRPACKCAQLMKIPLVYQSPTSRQNGYIKLTNPNLLRYSSIVPVSGPRGVISINEKSIQLYTAESVLSILHYNYINEGQELPSKNSSSGKFSYPKWFQIMAMIDTAHDFGHGNRTYKERGKARQFALTVRFLMVGLYTGTRDVDIPVPVPPGSPHGTIKMSHLIHSIFSFISDIEDAIGADLRWYVSNTGHTFNIGATNSTFYTPYNGYASLEDLLASTNSCIVYDQGSGVTPDLLHRMSLLSAKYSNSG